MNPDLLAELSGADGSSDFPLGGKKLVGSNCNVAVAITCIAMSVSAVLGQQRIQKASSVDTPQGTEEQRKFLES